MMESIYHEVNTQTQLLTTTSSLFFKKKSGLWKEKVTVF
jgi:hypothetical protein